MKNIITNHLSNPENGKVLIFAKHVETIKFLENTLKGLFPNMGVLKFIGRSHTEGETVATAKGENRVAAERANIIKKFNSDPSYPIMLANDAARTGVNLYGANCVINYDMDWNPQDINQRIDRAHRIRSIKDIVDTQRVPARNVYAHTLAVVGGNNAVTSTVEARKLAAHAIKQKMFDAMINKQRLDLPTSLLHEDPKTIMEELIDASSTKKPIRIDPERAREREREQQSGRRRAALAKRYGGFWASFFQ
jgi:superfamily II DNA/RNA helicase